MIAGEMRMDCAQFEHVLNGLDGTHRQAAAFPETVLAHAESCSECARLFLENLFRAQASPRSGEAVRE